MKLDDGIHEVDKIKPIMSVEGKVAAYIQGACFHAEKGEVHQGTEIVIEDGQVEGKIKPIPELEEIGG